MSDVELEEQRSELVVKANQQFAELDEARQDWIRPVNSSFGKPLHNSDSEAGDLDCGCSIDLYGLRKDRTFLARRPEEKSEAEDRSKQHDVTRVKVENRGASLDYARTVEGGLSTLPDTIAKELDRNGVKVYVFKDINSYDRAFGSHQAILPHASDAPSLFDKSANPPRIAVFEYLGDGAPLKEFERYDPAGLPRHEVGHAHDFLNHYLSATDSGFKGTFLSELEEMSPAKMRQLRQDIGTAENPGPLWRYLSRRSRDEFYAECFAVATGGGSDKHAEQLLRFYFPKTLHYVGKELKK
ncbi:MAG TPA: hypothetical protein V6D17_12555 [Candidatus Obscuribacterales bacterium]